MQAEGRRFESDCLHQPCEQVVGEPVTAPDDAGEMVWAGWQPTSRTEAVVKVGWVSQEMLPDVGVSVISSEVQWAILTE